MYPGPDRCPRAAPPEPYSTGVVLINYLRAVFDLFASMARYRSFRLQGACLGMWGYSKRAGCACVASGSRKLLKPMPTSRKRCSVLSSTRSRNASAMVVNSAQEEGGELGL